MDFNQIVLWCMDAGLEVRFYEYDASPYRERKMIQRCIGLKKENQHYRIEQPTWERTFEYFENSMEKIFLEFNLPPIRDNI